MSLRMWPNIMVVAVVAVVAVERNIFDCGEMKYYWKKKIPGLKYITPGPNKNRQFVNALVHHDIHHHNGSDGATNTQPRPRRPQTKTPRRMQTSPTQGGSYCRLR